jgi:hypothetical protein
MLQWQMHTVAGAPEIVKRTALQKQEPVYEVVGGMRRAYSRSPAARQRRSSTRTGQ